MGKQGLGLFVCIVLIGIVLSACSAPDFEIGCDVGELVQAINNANDNPDHTTITLAESCLYNLEEADNQIDWQEEFTGESGFTGLPPVTTPITIEGNQATIQRLGTAPEMRIFFVTSSGELTLEEVTLSNGLVQSGQIGFRNGGAIFNRGILALVSSHVLDSYAEDSGGGIVNDTSGILNIEGSSVSFNSAGAHGGAILNSGQSQILGYSIINDNLAAGTGGAITTTGSLEIIGGHMNNNHAAVRGGAISTGLQAEVTLEKVLFEGNQAEGSGGGAIFFTDATFSISQCTFNQNTTNGEQASGGAIVVGHAAGDILDGTTFNNNVSSRGGGGLYVYGDSTLTIESAVFENNTAALGGGGLSNAAQNMAVIVLNSTFTGNSALFGGGIANSGRVTVDSSLISSNTSSEAGAGIYNSGELLELVNSTVSGNTNQNVGGGILNYGSIRIISSTVAYNQAAQGAGLYANGDLVEIKNSIFSNNTPHSCSVFETLIAARDNLDDDGSCQGFNLTANPFLSPLADNGGPTLTHAFLFSSPAVDGALDCTNLAGSSTIDFDQRGQPRPFNGVCDLGAFEAQVTPVGFQAMVNVNIEELQCLSGPGDLFDWVASYDDGDSLAALGVNEDGTWLGIAGSNGGASQVNCWVLGEGVDSLMPLAGFPVLESPELPPEPAEEEEDSYNRCEIFEPDTYSLRLLDIAYGTGDLTLYVQMPDGVPGLELEVPEDLEPWLYSGILGDYQDRICTFDGYAGRLYCRIQIPENYFGSVRPFALYVNGCVLPIYALERVTIEGPQAPVCSVDLTEDACLASGGTYSCASSSDCTCVCP